MWQNWSILLFIFITFQQLYAKEYNDGKAKQNFKFHEIPLYISNKELQELLSVVSLFDCVFLIILM